MDSWSRYLKNNHPRYTMNRAPDFSKKEKLTVLSFGSGVQTLALLVLSEKGVLQTPRADVVIFADTGNEPPWVYETLREAQEWSSIPFVTVTKGVITDEVKDPGRGSFLSIPVYSNDGNGQLRRQCTREYKLDPVRAAIRACWRLSYRQRTSPRHASVMLGITIDEVARAKPSRVAWVENLYPMLDAGIRRSDCRKIIEGAGLTMPRKSSCIICPFHSDAYWIDLRDNHRDQWKLACSYDKAIRTYNQSGEPAYLHRSCKPLEEAKFKGDGQTNMWDAECEGYCGL